MPFKSWPMSTLGIIPRSYFEHLEEKYIRCSISESACLSASTRESLHTHTDVLRHRVSFTDVTCLVVREQLFRIQPIRSLNRIISVKRVSCYPENPLTDKSFVNEGGAENARAHTNTPSVVNTIAWRIFLFSQMSEVNTMGLAVNPHSPHPGGKSLLLAAAQYVAMINMCFNVILCSRVCQRALEQRDQTAPNKLLKEQQHQSAAIFYFFLNELNAYVWSN